MSESNIQLMIFDEETLDKINEERMQNVSSFKLQLNDKFEVYTIKEETIIIQRYLYFILNQINKIKFWSDKLYSHLRIISDTLQLIKRYFLRQSPATCQNIEQVCLTSYFVALKLQNIHFIPQILCSIKTLKARLQLDKVVFLGDKHYPEVEGEFLEKLYFNVQTESLYSSIETLIHYMKDQMINQHRDFKIIESEILKISQNIFLDYNMIFQYEQSILGLCCVINCIEDRNICIEKLLPLDIITFVNQRAELIHEVKFKIKSITMYNQQTIKEYFDAFQIAKQTLNQEDINLHQNQKKQDEDSIIQKEQNDIEIHIPPTNIVGLTPFSHSKKISRKYISRPKLVDVELIKENNQIQIESPINNISRLKTVVVEQTQDSTQIQIESPINKKSLNQNKQLEENENSMNNNEITILNSENLNETQFENENGINVDNTIIQTVTNDSQQISKHIQDNNTILNQKFEQIIEPEQISISTQNKTQILPDTNQNCNDNQQLTTIATEIEIPKQELLTSNQMKLEYEDTKDITQLRNEQKQSSNTQNLHPSVQKQSRNIISAKIKRQQQNKEQKQIETVEEKSLAEFNTTINKIKQIVNLDKSPIIIDLEENENQPIPNQVAQNNQNKVELIMIEHDEKQNQQVAKDINFIKKQELEESNSLNMSQIQEYNNNQSKTDQSLLKIRLVNESNCIQRPISEYKPLKIKSEKVFNIGRRKQPDSIIRSQQSETITRNQQSDTIARNQQSENIVRSQQSDNIVKSQQSDSIIRIQQQDNNIRSQQSNSNVKSQQSERFLRNQQADIERRQQIENYLRNKYSESNIKSQQQDSSTRNQQSDNVARNQQSNSIQRSQQQDNISRSQQQESIARSQQNMNQQYNKEKYDTSNSMKQVDRQNKEQNKQENNIQDKDRERSREYFQAKEKQQISRKIRLNNNQQ